MLLNGARKFWYILVLAILKTSPFSHHLLGMQLHSKFGVLALFCISLKGLERIFLKSLHIIFIMYIYNKVWHFLLRLIHCNVLKFQDKPILQTCQNSALQHSLFWPYANFSKIMPTIHTSMTSTFIVWI